VFDFYPKLAEKISQADLAISRAGASTLFELAANALPSIFIPYPYAAGDHQYHNAKYLADKNAGFVIKENETEVQKIKNLITSANLEEISKNLKNINKKNGAEIIVDQILSSLNG
jgi:UDP-N-acetylglucosamine--N-acetylmuramyl-(pentapeptide) pyrophosphoryl-undecaprenol N-acetylglucosamine transferase